MKSSTFILYLSLVLFYFVSKTNFTAIYKEGSKKHKSTIATSAYQEVDYGSQNTKLNKFFDEMLKKKIEKFSRKLKIIDDAKEAKNSNDDNDASTASSPQNEIILPLNDDTILEEDITRNGDVKIKVETGSSFSTYRPNPKMVQNFQSQSYESPSSDESLDDNKKALSSPTINDIPTSFNEKFDDDQLLEMFYGNHSDVSVSQNDQSSNDTNYNSKSLYPCRT